MAPARDWEERTGKAEPWERGETDNRGVRREDTPLRPGQKEGKWKGGSPEPGGNPSD